MKIKFEELENLIKNGNLSDCLEKMKGFASIKRFRSITNEILSEQSRLTNLQKQYNSGLINYEAFGIDESKIRNSIISIVDDLKSRAEISLKIDNGKLTEINQHFGKELLIGVWGCKHSSLSSDEIYFWSLLPNNFCIVNTLNKKTKKSTGKMFKWEFDKENQIIIQRGAEGEVKGIVKWLSSTRFELTILSILKPVMIYEKIL